MSDYILTCAVLRLSVVAASAVPLVWAAWAVAPLGAIAAGAVLFGAVTVWVIAK